MKNTNQGQSTRAPTKRYAAPDRLIAAGLLLSEVLTLITAQVSYKMSEGSNLLVGVAPIFMALLSTLYYAIKVVEDDFRQVKNASLIVIQCLVLFLVTRFYMLNNDWSWFSFGWTIFLGLYFLSILVLRLQFIRLNALMPPTVHSPSDVDDTRIIFAEDLEPKPKPMFPFGLHDVDAKASGMPWFW